MSTSILHVVSVPHILLHCSTSSCSVDIHLQLLHVSLFHLHQHRCACAPQYPHSLPVGGSYRTTACHSSCCLDHIHNHPTEGLQGLFECCLNVSQRFQIHRNNPDQQMQENWDKGTWHKGKLSESPKAYVQICLRRLPYVMETLST